MGDIYEYLTEEEGIRQKVKWGLDKMKKMTYLKCAGKRRIRGYTQS